MWNPAARPAVMPLAQRSSPFEGHTDEIGAIERLREMMQEEHARHLAESRPTRASGLSRAVLGAARVAGADRMRALPGTFRRSRAGNRQAQFRTAVRGSGRRPRRRCGWSLRVWRGCARRGVRQCAD